jgi:formylglycine-generating enzyme required for sulfatase activity
VTSGDRFAIRRYPVTFAENNHFCEAIGRDKPEDEGLSRRRRPVINVLWEAAQALASVVGEGDRDAISDADTRAFGLMGP